MRFIDSLRLDDDGSQAVDVPAPSPRAYGSLVARCRASDHDARGQLTSDLKPAACANPRRLSYRSPQDEQLLVHAEVAQTCGDARAQRHPGELIRLETVQLRTRGAVQQQEEDADMSTH